MSGTTVASPRRGRSRHTAQSMRISIKKRILVHQIALIALVVVSISVASLYIIGSHLLRLQRENIEFMVQKKIESIRQHSLYEKEELFAKIAGDEVIEVYARKSQDSILTEHFSKFRKEFSSLSFISGKGTEEFRLIGDKMSEDLRRFRGSALFEDALKAPGKVFATPAVCSDSGEPVMKLAFAHKTFFGEMSGIILGEFSTGDFVGNARESKTGKQPMFFLMDRHGTIISHPDKSMLCSKIAGEDRGSNEVISAAVASGKGSGRAAITGMDAYAVFAPLKEMGWSVMAILPYEEFMERPRALLGIIAGISSAVLLVAIMAALRLAKGISSPLVELTSITERVTRGDLTVKADIRSEDELGRLARSFNEMTRNLHTYQNHLEELVAERTIDITEANRRLQDEIAERKQAEEALHRSELHFRSLIENALDFIGILDAAGDISYASPSTNGIIGYGPDELVGRNAFDLIHPDDLPDVRNVFAQGIRIPGFTTAIDFRFRHKDGSWRILEAIGRNLLHDPSVSGIVINARDITDRKRIEEEKSGIEAQLIHAQKMEAVGQLAGGIAHDFNNILTAIISFGKLLEMKIDKNSPLADYPSHIISSAGKAARLTQSLLAFSRKQAIDPKPVEIGSIARGIEKLMKGLVGEDVEVLLTLHEEDLTVMADSVQIEQVLLNLAANARDAMPDGGTLTVATGRVDGDGSSPATHGSGRDGSCAVIIVSDTGTGMDERTKEKIFEPFFTTKEVGKGSGLGLAMAYGIVKQHNGFIDVCSEEGVGTSFTICLPLIAPAAVETHDADAAYPKGGKETILLAEDHREVRLGLREVLEEFGYVVIEAVDGEDALEKVDEHGGRIAMVILDVVMPRKNGRETYEKIKEMKPDVKVLFISGYTNGGVHKKALIGDGFDFVSKPVSPGELLRKVRSILDA